MTPRSSIQYRGRFAPTPSGPLHFGSLVTALASWLDARHSQGEWWLRIDDLDPPRQQPHATDTICRQLDSFGLHWDRKVLQSSRLAVYQAAVDQLLTSSHAFYCQLSRQQLADFPHGHPGPSVAVPAGPDTAIRLVVDDSALLLHDLFQPPTHVNLQDQGGAFVIRRRDGFFAYHLACAVDDANLGMTHVLRGADLLPCTPQQQQIMRCLGKTPPLYGHLPLITRGGEKLSKSSGSASLDDLPPATQLHQALRLLGLSPPAALTNASVTAILAWGVEHWSREHLPTQPVDINNL
jgi:glutamyl-Q tRNA(Asp) synthetase